MTWYLTFINDFEASGEHCLQLNNAKQKTQLRSWFGPLAKQLFQMIQSQLNHCHYTKGFHQHYAIEKQLAQHLLIQASFFHQRCLQLYQVNADIKRQQLSNCHALSELLLFIRMSSQHPSQSTIEKLIQCQLPWCDDITCTIETLLKAKLIQKINIKDLIFYDKNPYPHKHIFDYRNQSLKDHDGLAQVNQQQRLIKHPLNT